MTAFDRAFALLKDDDLIEKFTDPFGNPEIPLPTFLDYYPELLTANLEDLIPFLPESGHNTRVHLGLMPHHQPVLDEHWTDDEQRQMWGTKEYPEPIRPSGWWYSGYGDPSLRTLAREGGTEKHPSGVLGGWSHHLGEVDHIDPPPIDDIENIYFQTGLQQTGASSLWNRAHYQNQLTPTTWDLLPPEEIMGVPIPKKASRHSMWMKDHKDLKEALERATGIQMGEEGWYEAVDKPWKTGERFVESPISESKYPKELGERIRFEDQTFKDTQDLIAYLLSTPGEEEWSEKKRAESADLPFGGITQGHDTRDGRRAARRTKRMQERNE